MNVSRKTAHSLLAVALGGVTLLSLGGCASDSSSLQEKATTYLVTGIGDSRDEALENTKERALEQCEAMDRETFTILEQHTLSPDASAAQRDKVQNQLAGTTVDEDTDLGAITVDDDQYKTVWTIRCD
jgi:hypothetical protein